jgi:hypothetical protein
MALQERVWGSEGNTTAITNYGVTLETVRGDVRGYPVSQRGGAGKSLRHESIVVRCRCGLQGWFPPGCAGLRPALRAYAGRPAPW